MEKEELLDRIEKTTKGIHMLEEHLDYLYETLQKLKDQLSDLDRLESDFQ